MAPLSTDQLREMAQHRGLKLMKSRKRKPGVGDYGKYGLTDGAGSPLLGIDGHGFTATAADIENYLRTSSMNTWKKSADTTPDPPQGKNHQSRKKQAPRQGDKIARSKRPVKTERTGKKRGLAPPPAPRPVSKVPTAAASKPMLRVRKAAAADAPALARLLNQLHDINLDDPAVAQNLTGAARTKAGVTVAELDSIVGCCGWAVIPTLHRGPIGRVTTLIVDAAHRRQGIATLLLVEAEKALIGAGCSEVEVMSDISITSTHAFFRALNFAQMSYRFIRPVGG